MKKRIATILKKIATLPDVFLKWYKSDMRNRILALELIAVFLISAIGIVYYDKNKLHESDISPASIPDVYVSPVRYSLCQSLGNISIYALESRAINRSSVAILMQNSIILSTTDPSKPIQDLYGSSVFLYPALLSDDLILQDAEVGYKLCYQPAEMEGGIVASGQGEFSAYKHTDTGDILYGLNVKEYDTETESKAYSNDGIAYQDDIEYKLVLVCSSKEEQDALLENLFLSIESNGSYNANSGTIFVVSDDRNIQAQTIISQ